MRYKFNKNGRQNSFDRETPRLNTDVSKSTVIHVALVSAGVAILTLNIVIFGTFSIKGYLDSGEAAKNLASINERINQYSEIETELNKKIQNLNAEMSQTENNYIDLALDLENSIAALQEQLPSSLDDTEGDSIDEVSVDDYVNTSTTGWVFYGNRTPSTKVFRYLEYRIVREAENRSGNYGIYPHKDDILQPNMNHADSSEGRVLRETNKVNGELIKSLNTDDLLRVIDSVRRRESEIDYIWVNVILMERKP